MAYQKQKFIDYPNEGYTILNAEHLNHIENGIAQTDSMFPEMTANDFGKQLFVNKEGTGFLLLGNTHEEKWNLCEMAESIAAGTWEIGTRSPSTGSGQFDTYYFMPVKGNVLYYIGEHAESNQYWARCVNWYDKDKVFIGCVETTAASVQSPVNARFCTVTFYQNATPYWFTNIADEAERVDKVVNDSIQVDTNKWNLLQEASGFKDNYYVNGEVTNGGPMFFTYFNIPVKPRTKYFYSCNGFVAANPSYEYGARFINWYDENETLLETLNGPRGAVTSPVGAKYCTCTFLTSDGYNQHTTQEDVELYDQPFFTSVEDPEKRVDGEETYTILTSGVSSETLAQIEEAYEMAYEASETINEIEYLKNSKMYNGTNFVNTTRRGIVNFQFDDAPLAGDTAVKEVFDAYGYKCDFAITSNIATSSALNDYRQFEREGFGILSHSTDGTGYGSYSNSETVAAQTAKLKTSCDILRKAGFNIHGWVTPSSSLHANYYNDVAKIYDYGFGVSSLYNPSSKIHYFGSATHLAQMPRVGIEAAINKKVDSTTGDLKDEIKSYLQTFWNVSIIETDTSEEIVMMDDISFDTVVEKAIAHGYTLAAHDSNTLNQDAISYLTNVWGVDTYDTTLVMHDGMVYIAPTFKTASYRKGMADIKNYIDNAYATNGLLIFYSHNAGYIATNEHGWGEAALTEILNYCKKIDIAVMNAADAIQDMFSFRYTDFLELKGAT